MQAAQQNQAADGGNTEMPSLDLLQVGGHPVQLNASAIEGLDTTQHLYANACSTTTIALGCIDVLCLGGVTPGPHKGVRCHV